MKGTKALALVMACAMMAIATPLAGADDETSTTQTALVNVVMDISASDVPILYGNVDVGDENNPAQVGNGFPATITVEDTTNVNVNLRVKGENLTSSANVIGVENSKWDVDSDVEGATPLTEEYATWKANVSPDTDCDIYFWIDIPAGQAAGTYSGSVWFKAIEYT